MAEPAVFSLQLQFQKSLESSLHEPALNINKKMQETIKQFGLKRLSLCFFFNLRKQMRTD